MAARTGATGCVGGATTSYSGSSLGPGNLVVLYTVVALVWPAAIFFTSDCASATRASTLLILPRSVEICPHTRTHIRTRTQVSACVSRAAACALCDSVCAL